MNRNELIITELEIVLEELNAMPLAPHKEKLEDVISDLEEIIRQLKEIKNYID